MEPLDLTGVKEYASEIAQPLRDRLVEDICRRVKEAGAITTTAEYEIYRAEALGMAEKEIKAVSYTHLDVYKRQTQDKELKYLHSARYHREQEAASNAE